MCCGGDSSALVRLSFSARDKFIRKFFEMNICDDVFIDVKSFMEKENVQVYLDADVKPYLTMGIGGNVRLIAVVEKEQHLREVVVRLKTNAVPFVVLGGGSNVVFMDEFSPLVVIVNRTAEIVKTDNRLVKVNSGVYNRDLMAWCIANNAGGIDFMAGIPGTVGGAAAVNAGAFGLSISTLLDKAEIVSLDGSVKTVGNEYFDFTYRNSKFKYGEEVILSVFLRYTDIESSEVRRMVEERVNYRKANHPCLVNRSAGCFFKNPITDGQKASAGKMIEKAGFKGTGYKRLRVSEEHANFVINANGASFEEVQELENRIVEKVFQQNGVTLEREVIYITPGGKKH
jgi:UDP-N-acetylmuramate dehydrogenase